MLARSLGVPLSVAVVVLFVSQSSTARAQPGRTPAEPAADSIANHSSPELRVDDYTSSVVVSDAVAGGLIVAGTAFAVACFSATFELFEDEKPDDHPTCTLAVGGLVGGSLTYAVVPAIIHLKHDNGRGAALSLGARIGLPVLGVAAGAALSDGGDDLAGVGFLAGAGAAMLLDWTVLSKHERPAERFALTPVVAPSEGGMAFGIAGTL